MNGINQLTGSNGFIVIADTATYTDVFDVLVCQEATVIDELEQDEVDIMTTSQVTSYSFPAGAIITKKVGTTGFTTVKLTSGSVIAYKS